MQAIRRIDLMVAEVEVGAVIGPSGVGKARASSADCWSLAVDLALHQIDVAAVKPQIDAHSAIFDRVSRDQFAAARNSERCRRRDAERSTHKSLRVTGFSPSLPLLFDDAAAAWEDDPARFREHESTPRAVEQPDVQLGLQRGRLLAGDRGSQPAAPPCCGKPPRLRSQQRAPGS